MSRRGEGVAALAPPPLSEHLKALRDALEDHVPAFLLDQYMDSLFRAYLDDCGDIGMLAPSDLHELGIAIGHRRRLLIAARTIAGVPDAENLSSGSPSTVIAHHHHHYHNKGERADPFRASQRSNPLLDGPLAGARGARSTDPTARTSAAAKSKAQSAFAVPPSDDSSEGSSVVLSHDVHDVGRHALLLPPPLIAPASRSSGAGAGVLAPRALGDSAPPPVGRLDRTSEQSTSLSSLLPSFRRRRRRDSQLQPRLDTELTTHLSSTSAAGAVDGPPLTPGHHPVSSPTLALEWISLSGACATLEIFLHDMKLLRKSREFPSTFDRLFENNKPMPFVEIFGDGTMLGLLLRIPDLTDEEGSSVATITNRVCFMIHSGTGLVVTFHNCEADPLAEFHREWERGLINANQSLGKVVHFMVQCVLRTYNTGVTQLRDHLDELDSAEVKAALTDAVCVKKLTTISKKATVYKRCIMANREALLELHSVPWMDPYIKEICDNLSTTALMADELSSNSLSSIDLTIALSDFKSSVNIRNFTYMSILISPITVGTSWYGQNWSNMPELEYENGYFIWSAVLLAVALLVFTVFFYQEKLVVGLLSTLGRNGPAEDRDADGNAPRALRRVSKTIRLRPSQSSGSFISSPDDLRMLQEEGKLL